jgi:Fic family protein
MDDFVNTVNRVREQSDSVVLASFVLWRMNAIHPFINGNGRTARAASYFVLCVKSGGWLPGAPILPELLRQNRLEYVSALQAADQSLARVS